MLGVSLRLTSDAAPLQIEGYVRGKYVYFRERGGSWQFHVGKPGRFNDWDDLTAGLVDEGECPEFLDPITALGFVKTLIYVHLGVSAYHLRSRDVFPF